MSWNEFKSRHQAKYENKYTSEQQWNPRQVVGMCIDARLCDRGIVLNGGKLCSFLVAMHSTYVVNSDVCVCATFNRNDLYFDAQA